MQISKDNIRQKIIVFNNEYLIEESSPSRAKENSQSLITNSDNSDKEEEEMEINIILENGNNINFKFNLDENIYSRVDNFCKENNIDQNGQDLILQQIDSKLAEILKQKEGNNESNKKNDNEDNNVSNSVGENNINNNIENNGENNFENNIYDYNINNEENKNENNNNLERQKNNKLKNKNEMKKNINIHNRKLKDYEIGQRLYERGKKYNKRKQIHIEKMKTEILNNSPKYDFKPKLSKKTEELIKSTNRKMKIEDRLIKSGKERDKKILKKAIEIKLFEDQKINDLSSGTNLKNKRKNLTRNKSADVFNKLYNEKDILEKKAKKKEKIYFKKVFPFKPKITDMAKNMKKDKYKEIINKYNEKQLKKREKILQKEEEEKSINQKSKEKNININNMNNTKRRPKNYFLSKNIKNAKLRSKPIKNKLYSTYEKENSKNDFNEKYNKEMEQERKKNLDMKSNDIIKKIKEYKFKEIFNLLDLNKEGYLSYANISFINIEPKILEALSPLIGEINRNKNKKIFFNEFKNITNDSLSKCMVEDV